MISVAGLEMIISALPESLDNPSDLKLRKGGYAALLEE